MKFKFSIGTLLLLSTCFAVGAALQSNLHGTIASAKSQLASPGSRLYRELGITGGTNEHVTMAVRDPSASDLLLYRRTVDCTCESVTWVRKRVVGKVEGCYVDMPVKTTTSHSISLAANPFRFKVIAEPSRTR